MGRCGIARQAFKLQGAHHSHQGVLEGTRWPQGEALSNSTANFRMVVQMSDGKHKHRDVTGDHHIVLVQRVMDKLVPACVLISINTLVL